MMGTAGLAERQKEWQNDKMAEVVTYVLFMYTLTQWRDGVWNSGMVDWREWSNGGNGRNGGTAERMAERKWLYTYYLWYTPTQTMTPTTTTLKSFIIDEYLGIILGVFPSDLVCDLSQFWEMLLVLVFNTFSGNGQTAERVAEWQNGRNGYIRTIYGTRRHRQLLIFYSIDTLFPCCTFITVFV